MATIDEVKIIVKAEVDAAIDKMNKLNNTTKESNKSAVDFAKSIAGYTTGYNLAVDAGRKLISTVKDQIMGAVSLAAEYESVKVSLGVLFGSVERGNAAFSQWYSIAAKTPYAFEDIAKSGTRLASVQIPLEQIGDKIRMLGDLAMGQPEKLERLSDAYTQLKSRGVASMEIINRFTEAGIPIMGELEKQTGKAGAALFKQVEQGKIGYAELTRVLEALTSAGGAYYKMGEKTAETTKGLWSTALDGWNTRLANIGNHSLPFINKMLKEFIYTMDVANNATARQAYLTTGVGDAAEISAQILKEMETQQQIIAKDAKNFFLSFDIGKGGFYSATSEANRILKELSDNLKAVETMASAIQSNDVGAGFKRTIVPYKPPSQAENATELAAMAKINDMNNEALAGSKDMVAQRKLEYDLWKQFGKSIDEVGSNKIAPGSFLDKSVWDTLDESTKKSIEQAKKMEEQWKVVSKVISESLVGAASAFGQALIEGQDPAKAFFKTIIDSVGNAVIAYAALTEAQGWATWPISDWTKIGAGISLAVLGGTIKGIAASMAEGGMVKAQPGGTAVILAEAGEDEFVIPRSKMASAMGKQGNTYIYAPQIAGSVIRERELEAIGARGFMRMMRNY